MTGFVPRLQTHPVTHNRGTNPVTIMLNGHVLQTLLEQLKVPGSRLEGSELLISEFRRFRSRLNETSGGSGPAEGEGEGGASAPHFLEILKSY